MSLSQTEILLIFTNNKCYLYSYSHEHFNSPVTSADSWMNILIFVSVALSPLPAEVSG